MNSYVGVHFLAKSAELTDTIQYNTIQYYTIACSLSVSVTVQKFNFVAFRGSLTAQDPCILHLE